jgi:aspartate/methionine/tyrosine aminotransferase
VGYVVAQEEITEQIRNMHDFHTVTAPHPFQVALAGALGLPDGFYVKLRHEYWERKKLLCEAIEKCGMTFYEPGAIIHTFSGAGMRGCRTKMTPFSESA